MPSLSPPMSMFLPPALSLSGTPCCMGLGTESSQGLASPHLFHQKSHPWFCPFGPRTREGGSAWPAPLTLSSAVFPLAQFHAPHTGEGSWSYRLQGRYINHWTSCLCPPHPHPGFQASNRSSYVKCVPHYDWGGGQGSLIHSGM